MRPAMTPQQAHLSDSGRSSFAMYREFAVGDSSLPFFCGYELATLIGSNLPGLAGFGFRALVYPFLFGAVGRRPAIGRGVVLRNPRGVTLGHKVMIDDYGCSTCGARGPGSASVTT